MFCVLCVVCCVFLIDFRRRSFTSCDSNQKNKNKTKGVVEAESEWEERKVPKKPKPKSKPKKKKKQSQVKNSYLLSTMNAQVSCPSWLCWGVGVVWSGAADAAALCFLSSPRRQGCCTTEKVRDKCSPSLPAPFPSPLPSAPLIADRCYFCFCCEGGMIDLVMDGEGKKCESRLGPLPLHFAFCLLPSAPVSFASTIPIGGASPIRFRVEEVILISDADQVGA